MVGSYWDKNLSKRLQTKTPIFWTDLLLFLRVFSAAEPKSRLNHTVNDLEKAAVRICCYFVLFFLYLLALLLFLCLLYLINDDLNILVTDKGLPW